ERGQHAGGGFLQGFAGFGGGFAVEADFLDGTADDDAAVAPGDDVALAVQQDAPQEPGRRVELDDLAFHGAKVAADAERLDELAGPGACGEDDARGGDVAVLR